MKNFEVRRGEITDADGIFAAHVDSICSIGSLYYVPEIVDAWKLGLNIGRYIRAMSNGEIFHIAVDPNDRDEKMIVGFSSYRYENGLHRTAVYVRGIVSRQGIGTTLFQAAESAAIVAGAKTIHVDASLAAIEFYRRNGFEETSRGEHKTSSGVSIACVFMRKHLNLDT